MGTDDQIVALCAAFSDLRKTLDLRLVEKSGPRQVQQVRGHNGWIRSIAFSPDGSKIVSGSGDETI
jgi:WD40 repeat protein